MNQTVQSVSESLNIKPRTLKIFAVLAIILFIIAVNASGPGIKTKSKFQNDYELWLQNTQLLIKNGAENVSLPTLTLKMLPKESGAETKELKLVPYDDTENKTRILRILELVREAELFELKKSHDTSEVPGDILLNIESPEKTFQIKFNQKNIATNIKASLMLKLFDEFAKVNLAPKLEMTNADILPNKEAQDIPSENVPALPQ